MNENEITVRNPIQTIHDVTVFEKISPRLSNKYVPIFTSDIINILSPEFKLVGGARIHTSSTTHYVDLESKDGLIRLYNSFDGNLALSANYIVGDIVINLDIERLIHRGNKATTFLDDLKQAKQEIIDAVPAAIEVAKKLHQDSVTPELQKMISDIIFEKEIKKEGFVEYTNYTDVVVDNKRKDESPVSVASYINSTINNYFKGLYTVTIGSVKTTGKKHSSVLTRITFQNKIIKKLRSEKPEYFL